jgi:hypothetical protein
MHTQDARARYIIVKEDDSFVFIEDIGTGRSVTNDAEAVVYELFNKESIGDKRIIYKDTNGDWDELVHDGDRFVDFAPYRKPVIL